MSFQIYSNIFIITAGIVSIFELLEYLFTKNIPWLFKVIRNFFRWLKRKWRRKYGDPQVRRLVLNFATHTITPKQIEAIKVEMGWPTIDVFNANIPNIPENTFFTKKVLQHIDKIDLLPQEWQTTPIVVIPAGYANIWSIILADIHGRLGYFPDIVRLRPSPSGAEEKFEVVEIIELRDIRNKARAKRLKT